MNNVLEAAVFNAELVGPKEGATILAARAKLLAYFDSFEEEGAVGPGVVDQRSFCVFICTP